MENEIKIGIFTIKQQDIHPDDFNRRRWFVYKNGKAIGRYRSQKKAVLSTKG
jgi:hypothetical protein